MKLLRLHILFAILAGMGVIGCKKESQLSPSGILTVGKDVRVNELLVISDSVWLACGGERDRAGFVWRTDNAGETWQEWSPSMSKSLYTLGISPTGKIYVGGDFLHYWTSLDTGRTWTFEWLADQVPVHEQDRPAIRRFAFAGDSCIYFCAGENLQVGTIYQTRNAGQNWDFLSTPHELRALYCENSEVVVTAGHGVILSTRNGMNGWIDSGWENDFISGLVPSGNGLVACGLQGGLYRSEDGGLTWSARSKAARTGVRLRSFTGVAARGEKVVVCGFSGMLFCSSDYGNSWEAYQIAENPELLSVTFLNDERILATADNGLIYMIALP